MIDLKNPGKIGSGITERSLLSVGLTGALIPESVTEGGRESFFRVRVATPAQRAFEVILSACKDPHGVPEEKMWEYFQGEVPRLARKILRGETEYRAYEHPEWYAAQVLVGADSVRRLIREGKADKAAAEALTLGAFVEEGRTKAALELSVLAHRRSRAGAAKGGSKKKSIPAVTSYVRSRLRGNPSATASALWMSIPDDDPPYSYVSVGKAKKTKLYRELGRVCIEKKQGEEWHRVGDISERAFRDYVAAARPPRRTR